MAPSGPHQLKERIESLRGDIDNAEREIERLPRLRAELANLEEKLAWYNRPDEQCAAEEAEKDAIKASLAHNS